GIRPGYLRDAGDTAGDCSDSLPARASVRSADGGHLSLRHVLRCLTTYVPAAPQRTCSLPLREVVARLRTTIKTAGFRNLGEIDPQAFLQGVGYAINPARHLLFFHPRYAARLLAADPAAFLEVPLKFAVLE